LVWPTPGIVDSNAQGWAVTVRVDVQGRVGCEEVEAQGRTASDDGEA